MAAARLGIGQPAVSRMLSQLEARVGRPLFVRDGAGLAPTADALAIYEEVITIMSALNRIETFSSTGAAEGTLRIAVPPTIAHCLLDGLTSRFLADHPHVHVTVDVITTPQVLEYIVDGRVDVGVAEIPDMELPAGVRKVPYRRSQYVCALRDDHPLAVKEVIQPTDLHDLPFIALVRRNSARAMIDRHLAKSGSVPNVVVETSNAMSAINYVAAGSGIAIVNSFPLTLVEREHVTFRGGGAADDLGRSEYLYRQRFTGTRAANSLCRVPAGQSASAGSILAPSIGGIWHGSDIKPDAERT